MIEAWLAAIFAIVIVLGMVAARVWTTLGAQILPMVRDWVIERVRGDDRFRPSDIDPGHHHELARRIQDLEDQVQFLEALLERGRGTPTMDTGDSAAPSERATERAGAPT